MSKLTSESVMLYISALALAPLILLQKASFDSLLQQ